MKFTRPNTDKRAVRMAVTPRAIASKVCDQADQAEKGLIIHAIDVVKGLDD